MRMRWKADLPKMPRLPKVLPDEPRDPAADALGPPPAPRLYREKNPLDSQPTEYQSASMLIEHRGLALLFLAAAIGFAVYCLRPSPRTVARDAPAARSAARSPAAAQAQAPIYVEALPDKER